MIEFETALQRAKALRAQLHEMPEASGCEAKTKQILIVFLKQETDLEIHDCGNYDEYQAMAEASFNICFNPVGKAGGQAF